MGDVPQQSLAKKMCQLLDLAGLGKQVKIWVMKVVKQNLAKSLSAAKFKNSG